MLKPNVNRLLNGFLALVIITFFSSCDKEDSLNIENLDQLEQIAITPKSKSNFTNLRLTKPECGTATTVRLMAGQHIPIGEVSAYNDNNNFYITISIEGDYEKNWFIRKAHLFVGEQTAKEGMKNPSPGKFPDIQDFVSENNTGVQVHTYTFPKSSFEAWGQFDIAIHAEVVRVAIDADENIIFDANNRATIVQKEGAWGEGKKFSDLNNIKSNNWAMYFSYQIQNCITICSPSWTRIVSRSNNGEEIEEFDFNEYDILKDGKIVGKATYKRDKVGGTGQNPIFEISVEFEITEVGYTYDEFSAIYQSSAFSSGLTRNNFTSFGTTPTGGTITFTGITGTTYWLGLYAKISGNCD